MKSRTASTTVSRVNITLPAETLNLLKRVSGGNRSRFIDKAVKHYAATQSRANLRKLLKEGALRNAARDLEIAEEWFPLDEEAWESLEK